jgi:hypothetical protein
VQPARRTSLERRVSGRQTVAFPEAKEANDPVYVEKEERLLSFFGHKKSVTNIRSWGTVGLNAPTVAADGVVQTAVQNQRDSVKLEGYGSEI